MLAAVSIFWIEDPQFLYSGPSHVCAHSTRRAELMLIQNGLQRKTLLGSLLSELWLESKKRKSSQVSESNKALFWRQRSTIRVTAFWQTMSYSSPSGLMLPAASSVSCAHPGRLTHPHKRQPEPGIEKINATCLPSAHSCSCSVSQTSVSQCVCVCAGLNLNVCEGAKIVWDRKSTRLNSSHL